MEEAAVKVCNLIRRIPECIFAYDFQKISDYYEIPLHNVELLFYGINDECMKNLLSRGDFIFSGSGLKCIEYNMTASLGGWELDILESYYRRIPLISKFLKENDVRIRRNHFFSVLFGFLVDRALKKFSNDIKRINIAIVMPTNAPLYDEPYLNESYENFFQQKNSPLKGKIIVCTFDQLDTINDSVFYKDERIHIIIEMTVGIVPFLILLAAESGNILLYNGPISVIMSSKLNLALLSEHEDSDIFSLNEREVIKKYIPWTRKIMPGKTTYRNREISLIDFILSYKDKLVIKPSSGAEGEGVYLGHMVSDRQWDILIKKAAANKNYVVQEYIEPLSYMYQSGECGCVEHQVIWGFFVFGSQYAGGTVRMLPIKSKERVINVGQGAEKSIIIEVER
jgi:hypothetical protein